MRFTDPTGHFAEAGPGDPDNAPCGVNMKDCGPQLTGLPQRTSLGQTKDRALGVLKGGANDLLDFLGLLGAPDPNLQQVRDFFNLYPDSQNQKFGVEIAGIFALFSGGEDVIKAIAGGHAVVKHLAEFAEFGVKDKEGLAKIVKEVMTSPKSETKALSGGRTAFYDSERNIVVFHHPKSVDKGTVFRPTEGRAYFDRQK